MRAALIAALAALSGCAVPAALPTALGAAGGAASLVRNVLGVDVEYKALLGLEKPGKAGRRAAGRKPAT
jgi:hypothetical protein